MGQLFSIQVWRLAVAGDHLGGTPGVHFAAREEPAMLATDITGFLQRLRDAARRPVQMPERLTFNTYCI